MHCQRCESRVRVRTDPDTGERQIEIVHGIGCPSIPPEYARRGYRVQRIEWPTVVTVPQPPQRPPAGPDAAPAAPPVDPETGARETA